ncbi:4-hydroxy-tetrahydrodipicolinate synthase [Mesosutterella sp. AGMB02718]|uniref:4-hydroxy-tetrahydrodipicolinate synthase n=1 Tax=Mesosutterella faecium TaxID=2925194 RepID=A0ABT7ILT6_9BURK|nr:4-hydroxy-tetrahydrodipicolinate synthase [Mesosutterella sp. AGMB02718]MDL2059338.1 4-hydroxy-tetrahydrodipicolinate synthase [Mesosutterella sp. AGMB02718]
MIKGSMIAIVTPMREDGSIDYDSYQKLIDWQVSEGADAIVSMGTSGESPTVSFQEHTDVVKAAVEAVGGRVPVVAGTGANSTAEAVRLTQEARAVGADYSLQVVPYYNKPTQEGLFRHFSTVAKEGGLPVILYNVPGRTGRDMTNETVLRLAEVPGIAGLKDATGDLARAESLLAALPKDSGFALYSGNDDSALSLMLAGGQGVISVTANVAPRLMHEMAAAAIAGDVARAREINARLLPLHHELFCESNPIPVKWALWRMGRIPAGIRLPLTWLSEPGQKRVEKALAAAGLI